MLKFLRRYTKYMLAIFGSLLMVIFLLPAGTDFFRPGPGDTTIGYLQDEPVTLNQQRVAQADLEVLAAIHPAMADRGVDDDPSLRWLLMLEEARRLGLEASEYEVEEVFAALGLDETAQRQLARNLGQTPDFIRESIKHWIVVQRLKELIFGVNHYYGTQPLTPAQRLAFYNEAMNYAQYGIMPLVIQSMQASRGQLRISEPLLKHTLQDQQASLEIAAVAIPVSQVMDDVAEVDDAAVRALFEKYKDNFPGEGEVYGFGYKIPDRVRLEYLAIPHDRVRASIELEEAELLKYYKEHPDAFLAPATGAEGEAREPLPYLEVRDRVRAQVLDERGAAKAAEMIRAARAMLERDARSLPTSSGYRVVPEDFQPMALSAVAEALQEEFGVLPDVVRVDDRWLTEESLPALDGIGMSHLADRPDVRFADYVLSARELTAEAADDTEEPAAPTLLGGLYLQRLMPSLPLESPAGGTYLFRVLAAEAAHAPASLDQVREQVAFNAKQVAAFEKLVDEKAKWTEMAVTGSLADVAAATGQTVLTPPPFSRREMQMFGGGLTVPTVEGIGQEAEFVDAVFNHALMVLRGSEQPPSVDALAATDRVVAVPVPSQQTLYVVSLRDFEPMSEADFTRMASREEAPTWIEQSLYREELDPENPLSIKALSARLGYVPEETEEEGI